MVSSVLFVSRTGAGASSAGRRLFVPRFKAGDGLEGEVGREGDEREDEAVSIGSLSGVDLFDVVAVGSDVVVVDADFCGGERVFILRKRERGPPSKGGAKVIEDAVTDGSEVDVTRGGSASERPTIFCLLNEVPPSGEQQEDTLAVSLVVFTVASVTLSLPLLLILLLLLLLFLLLLLLRLGIEIEDSNRCSMPPVL